MSSRHMPRLLTPLLWLLGLALLACMFFVKFDIPWEDLPTVWLMAFIFHVPLRLFLIAAVTVEIKALVERKHVGRLHQR